LRIILKKTNKATTLKSCKRRVHIMIETAMLNAALFLRLDYLTGVRNSVQILAGFGVSAVVIKNGNICVWDASQNRINTISEKFPAVEGKYTYDYSVIEHKPPQPRFVSSPQHERNRPMTTQKPKEANQSTRLGAAKSARYIHP